MGTLDTGRRGGPVPGEQEMLVSRTSRRQTPLGRLAKRFAEEEGLPYTTALHAVDCAVAAAALAADLGPHQFDAAMTVLRRRRAVAALPLGQDGEWFDVVIAGGDRRRSVIVRTGPGGEELWFDRKGREMPTPSRPRVRRTDSEGILLTDAGDIDFGAYHTGGNPFDVFDQGFATCDRCAGRIGYHDGHDNGHPDDPYAGLAAGWYHLPDDRGGWTPNPNCLNGSGPAYPRRLHGGTCRICGDDMTGQAFDNRCGVCERLEESVYDAHLRAQLEKQRRLDPEGPAS
jgi:hypothetical protein